MDTTNTNTSNTSNTSDDEDYSDMPELISFESLSIKELNNMPNQYMFRSISDYNLESIPNNILEPKSLYEFNDYYSSNECDNEFNKELDNEYNNDIYNLEPPHKRRCSSEPPISNSNIQDLEHIDWKCSENNKNYRNNLILENNEHLLYTNELLLDSNKRIEILETFCKLINPDGNSENCPVIYCKCKGNFE